MCYPQSAIIPEAPNYIVFEDGIIVNAETGREIKPYPNSGGYLRVDLRVNGNREQLFVHRIVAEAFIPNKNPELFTEVNHRNGNRTDNDVFNLEWVTGEYNKHYARSLNRKYRFENG